MSEMLMRPTVEETSLDATVQRTTSAENQGRSFTEEQFTEFFRLLSHRSAAELIQAAKPEEKTAYTERQVKRIAEGIHANPTLVAKTIDDYFAGAVTAEEQRLLPELQARIFQPRYDPRNARMMVEESRSLDEKITIIGKAYHSLPQEIMDKADELGYRVLGDKFTAEYEGEARLKVYKAHRGFFRKLMNTMLGISYLGTIQLEGHVYKELPGLKDRYRHIASPTDWYVKLSDETCGPAMAAFVQEIIKDKDIKVTMYTD